LPKLEPQQRIPISANLIIQVLVAFACLLSGAVLPQWYPEFRGIAQIMLLSIGGVSGLAACANILFGRRISQWMARIGVRSRVVIPREGLVYLAIMLLMAVGGLVGHSNMLLLVFGLMAGPWIVNGWFVYMALRNVSVERHPRGHATVGQPLVVDVTVKNDKKWFPSYMLDVRDEVTSLQSGSRGVLAAGIVTLARIPAGERRTGRYELTFEKRGRYSLGPLRVSSRFPLGFGERGQLFPDSCEILIRPRVLRLHNDWIRRRHDQSESPHRESMQRGVYDDEFHHIREFRDGDNPRSIHWRTTARRGQLMVQERHQNGQADMFVILDLSADGESTVEEIELAVSVAATLCTDRASGGTAGQSLLAVTGKSPAFVSDMKPSRFVSVALDALAVCEPSQSPSLETALRDLAEAGALQQMRGVLITTRPEYCRLSVMEICSELIPDALDIMCRLNVVAASIDNLMMIARAETHDQAGNQFDVRGIFG